MYQSGSAWSSAERKLIEQRRAKIKGVKIPPEIKVTPHKVAALRRQYTFYTDLAHNQVERLGFSKQEAIAVMRLYHMRYSYTKDYALQSLLKKAKIPKRWLFEEIDKITKREEISQLYRKIQERIAQTTETKGIKGQTIREEFEEMYENRYGESAWEKQARSEEDASRADLLPGPSGYYDTEPTPGGEE